MASRTHAVALLKVLIAAAWADARFSQSELNYIKELAKKFHLTDQDWLELEPHLEEAPTDNEVDAFFQDVLTRIGSPSGRDEVVRHLQGILSADENVTAEEHDFLEEYSAILKQASTVNLLLGRLKGLFHRQPQVAVVDLDEFIRNKVFFKLRRRIGIDQITPEMYHLCQLGGLMGVVAHADGEIDARELEEIRRQIQFRGNFDADALEVLMVIIEEEAVRGLDRARLVSEYTTNSSFDDRIALLDLLFGVAGANGSLTHAELEELRGISSAMHLSHRQYIHAKLRLKK
jgi:uncharacterized tellurite resistance protein B-like protein